MDHTLKTVASMVSRSIILSVMVAVLTLQGALAQNSTTASSETISSLATSPSSSPTSQSSSTTLTGSSATTTATINPTATSQQTVSTTPVSSSSTPVHTTTKPPSERTCGLISIELQTKWQDSYNTSNFHKQISNSLEGAFNDSSKHSDVMVSDVTLKQKEETAVILSAKLCVVVHATGYFEVKIPKDGKIANIPVVEGSVKFTVLGVKFTDWKAKGEECKKCSDGGGGPFVIEGKCNTDGYSCNGVKTTKETVECETYCHSGAVDISGISTLILAVAVLLSSSFSFWE